MIRMMGNLLRAVFCIGVAGLIGYYNFEINSWVGLATNVAFFALGFLLVSTWKNPEKKRSEESLEALSSKGTTPSVVVVEKPVIVDDKIKMVEPLSDSTPIISPIDPAYGSQDIK